MRDVIMPGVGLYRTQASRTGEFAGMTEPEFGPDVTTILDNVSITYPEWCRVTVKRALKSGIMAEFTAKEYWIENYATKGGKERSIAPNTMWAKRVKGQIAKCAQAQALRIAFPELSAAPTAEEMEGKSLTEVDDTPPPPPAGPVAPPELIAAAEAAVKAGVTAYSKFWTDIGRDKRHLLASRHDGFKADSILADKARTVDVEAKPVAEPAPPPAEAAEPPPPATTGNDGVDDFIRGIEAEEKRQAGDSPE